MNCGVFWKPGGIKPCGGPPYPAMEGGGRWGKPLGGAARGAVGVGGGLACIGGGTLP